MDRAREVGGRVTEVEPTVTDLDARLAADHFIGCGEGWRLLISELHARLYELDPSYSLYRVGRAQGCLLFDAQPTAPGLAERFEAEIAIARRNASNTCECCGRPGVKAEVSGLAEVLCAAHLAAAEATAARLKRRRPKFG